MKRWLVRITPGDPGQVIEAERYELREGGSLRLVNGSVFEPRLVRAYAPTAWHTAEPVPEESA